jgi:hypothetical protein
MEETDARATVESTDRDVPHVNVHNESWWNVPVDKATFQSVTRQSEATFWFVNELHLLSTQNVRKLG